MEETAKFDFWSDHSRIFLEMAFSTDRQEVLHGHPFTGKNTGDCGDTVEVYLDIDEKDIIRSVKYSVEGCLNTNACANSIAHLAEGKHIDKAWEITAQTVIDFLETLPSANYHCAELAVGSFYRALNSVKSNKDGE